LTDEQPGPFTHVHAAVWTAGVTFVFLLVGSMVHGEAEHIDTVKIVGVQLMVYLSACALFSWRRQGRTFSELFAMRRTSFWLLLLCLLLGPALVGPTETVGRVIEHFSPQAPDRIQETLDALTPRSALHGALLVLLLSIGGPLVEELFFRGAIYTAMRPTFDVGSALWTTTLCFTLAHPTPRDWPPILLSALILSLLRAQSGSLWPGFVAHAGFNASTIAALWLLDGKQVTLPLEVEVAGWALTAVTLGGALVVAHKSQLAREARSVDEIAPPEPRPEP